MVSVALDSAAGGTADDGAAGAGTDVSIDAAAGMGAGEGVASFDDPDVGRERRSNGFPAAARRDGGVAPPAAGACDGAGADADTVADTPSPPSNSMPRLLNASFAFAISFVAVRTALQLVLIGFNSPDSIFFMQSRQ